MLNRNVSLVVCLSVMAGAMLAQTTPGTSYVVEFGNSGSTGQFQGFPSNTSTFGTPAFSASGPAGATQIIPKPDGTKYYVVGSGTVDDYGPSVGTPNAVNGIQGVLNPPNSTVQSCSFCPPAQTVISPDGNFLLIPSSVGTGAGAVYVLNTSTDAVIMTQAISGAVVGIVVSRDSKTAYILGESSQTFITTINLSTLQQTGAPVILKDPVTNDSLGGGATAFSISPVGLLYVSASNGIIQIDPTTLKNTQPNFYLIQVSGTPGPLAISSDSTMAYFVNETPNNGGQSILSVSLAKIGTIPAYTTKSWPTFSAQQQLQQYDQIVIANSANPMRIFAHTPGNTTLWDVAPDLSTVTVSTLNSVLPASSVLSFAVSDELPASQYLYALIGGSSQATIYRVVLSTNTVDSQASTLGPGTLQFAIVPPQSNPTSVTTFNGSQLSLTAGATAAPLIGRILDPIGRPMYNVPVTFSGDPSLIFANCNAQCGSGSYSTVSNEDGYVQATVTMGNSTEPPNQYPVTLTAGTGTVITTATFSLAIPGAGVGPTNPNGPNLMTIISGNGQLCESGLQCPGGYLTVQEVDSTGKPVVNDDVTFTVTGPDANIGFVTTGPVLTDAQGMATAQFSPQPLQYNIGFEGTTVSAVGTYGAVIFNETVYQLEPNNPGASPPTAFFSVPTNVDTIYVGEGDTLPGAFTVTVFNHAFPSQALSTTPGAFIGGSLIPDVAINITSTGADSLGNIVPVGSCQGNPLTADTGNSIGQVTCNFVASCSVGLGYHSATVDLGNYLDNTFQIYFTPGQTTALAINSGNNQSGRPGTALTLPLTATVTDKCGNPSANVTVVWKVTQGSATLATTSTVSNQGGNVSTHLTLGQVPGTVQVTATIGTSTLVTFTETVQAVVGTLKLVSGGGQSALINQPFSAPLVFQINDTTNNPVQNLTVAFALTGGNATLSSTTATTNAQGQVSLNVTAGGIPGAVSITATYATFTASASLTVTTQGPGVSVSSFTNWASGQAGLAPCGLAIVTGSGLAPGITGVINGTNLGIGPWPYTLSGVSISINGTPVPIAAVSNQNGVQQVYFQTPCEIVTGSPATVVVQVGSASSQVAGVTVFPAEPGIFTYAGPGGAAYAYVVDSNGNAITPSNLASAGNTYYMVVTGLGQTTPAAITNAVGTGAQTISPANVILAINNVGVPVTSVQYQQGERGQYLIAFTIPVPFATGSNLPISLGVKVNAQTFFENSATPVVLPGIH